MKITQSKERKCEMLAILICYFFSCFSCLFKTYWGHVDVWESDCVDCVGGGIGLSNSFSSVLPFSFPTSKLGIMQEYGVRFHAPTQH